MTYTKVKLQQCPKETEVEVYFTETDIETVGDTPGIHAIEIDEVNYGGDILTIFAWYDYNQLIDELTEHLKGK